MIDKVIHYIWIGGGQLDKNSKICINTCRRHMVDYKIVMWNESNLKLNQYLKDNRFFRECYKLKLWAFASDYLRLRILYEYGGIYLDTDVEVVKKFDDLLDTDFFIGLEKDDFIGTGIIAAEKGNAKIKKLLDFYDADIWKVDYINNPIIFRHVIDSNQDLFANAKIYPRSYFAPYSPDIDCNNLVDAKDTYAIHWYNMNWGMSRKGYIFSTTKHIENDIVRALIFAKRFIGYYRKGIYKQGKK